MGAISTVSNRDDSVVRREPHGLLLRLATVACHARGRARWNWPRCRSGSLRMGLHQSCGIVESSFEAAQAARAAPPAGALDCARQRDLARRNKSLKPIADFLPRGRAEIAAPISPG